MEKQRYNSIDLFKFVMSIFVVAYHTIPIASYSVSERVTTIFTYIVSLAVPFFFLSTGFLLGKKFKIPLSSKENIDKLNKQLLKISKMYLIWSIIYIPLEIWNAKVMNISLYEEVYSYIKMLIFVGEHFNSWVLWYLLSTIYALLLLSIFIKMRFSINTITIIAILIMFVSFGIDYIKSGTCSNFYILNICKNVIDQTVINGRIFQGAFYIPFGMFLANKRISIKLSFVMAIIGGIGTCILYNTIIGKIWLVVSAIGIFEIIVNMKLKAKFVCLRNMSIYIFLTHLYVWTFYYMVKYGERTYGMDCFIFTLMVSCLVSYVLISLKRKWEE